MIFNAALVVTAMVTAITMLMAIKHQKIMIKQQAWIPAYAVMTAVIVALSAGLPAFAEKADKNKPINLEADSMTHEKAGQEPVHLYRQCSRHFTQYNHARNPRPVHLIYPRTIGRTRLRNR